MTVERHVSDEIIKLEPTAELAEAAIETGRAEKLEAALTAIRGEAIHCVAAVCAAGVKHLLEVGLLHRSALFISAKLRSAMYFPLMLLLFLFLCTHTHSRDSIFRSNQAAFSSIVEVACFCSGISRACLSLPGVCIPLLM